MLAILGVFLFIVAVFLWSKWSPRSAVEEELGIPSPLTPALLFALVETSLLACTVLISVVLTNIKKLKLGFGIILAVSVGCLLYAMRDFSPETTGCPVDSSPACLQAEAG